MNKTNIKHYQGKYTEFTFTIVTITITIVTISIMHSKSWKGFINTKYIKQYHSITKFN